MRQLLLLVAVSLSASTSAFAATSTRRTPARTTGARTAQPVHDTPAAPHRLIGAAAKDREAVRQRGQDARDRIFEFLSSPAELAKLSPEAQGQRYHALKLGADAGSWLDPVQGDAAVLVEIHRVSRPSSLGQVVLSSRWGNTLILAVRPADDLHQTSNFLHERIYEPTLQLYVGAAGQPRLRLLRGEHVRLELQSFGVFDREGLHALVWQKLGEVAPEDYE